MSDYQTVIIEQHQAVAVVSLNRTDALNSFDAEMRRELLLAVLEVNEDDSYARGCAHRGWQGFQCRCRSAEVPAGGADGDFRVEDQLNGEYKPILMEISEAPKPWISAVNGPCAGIGSAFAMACDLTVMADDAYIYQAFTAISLVPDGGATWHLVRTLGRKRAYEVIVTGEKIRPEKCLDWGLCNRVVPPAAELLPQTLAWAQELAAKAPLALRYAKEALNGAIENSVADTISDEARAATYLYQQQDSAEGVLAFREKREPVWQGR